MKVVFLAAGRSKRMEPIPDKNFLSFLGKPLIYHQLKTLVSAGFSEFVVVGGAHNRKDLEEFVASDDAKQLARGAKVSPHFSIAVQENLDTGMAGAVLACQSYVANEPILVVNSNDIVDLEAYLLILEASKSDGDVFMIGKKVDTYFPGGYITLDRNGFLTKIIEKPGAGKEPSDMVNLVIHVHKNPHQLFTYLQDVKSSHDDLYELAIDRMIQDGKKIRAVPYDGFWQAIKYPWHTLPVARHFFEKSEKSIADSVEIADSTTIKGDVILEEGVRIFEGAVLNGPVYLGKNTIVANNALVRDSFLGEHCVVGYNTEVARSFLGNDVWMHTNYIGDSIISDHVSFGSGAVTANLRLDENIISTNIQGQKIECGSNKLGAIIGPNVRIGVNTSIMPGVRIGEHSFIGAGIIIPHDIEKESYVVGDVNLKIRKNAKKIDLHARSVMRKKL